MDNPRIVVGREGCAVKDIWEIIKKCTVLAGIWSEFARHLRIGSMEINELRQRKQLDKISHSDIIYDILEKWVTASGADARLDTLLHVVEEDCQASDVGESLRQHFKLPPKLPKESPAALTPLRIMIPDRPNYYIPRTLITRNIISSDIFRNNSPDIFLIEDMDRSELRKLVKDKLTGDSKEQINCAKIDPRFIILNQRNHFGKICEKIGKLKPVHYLKKEEDGRLRWIRSHGDITYLQGYLDQSQDELSEHDFCQTMTTQRAPVCISDSPGMGKSLLLAEIGSRLTQIFPGRKISFIALTEFLKLVKKVGVANLLDSTIEVLQDSFGWTFPQSSLDSEAEEEICFELLLDGFDELDSQDHQMGYELLKTIHHSYKFIRLWVTSRPHLLAELERHLYQLGNNIRAFHLDDQIQFLSSYWSRKSKLNMERCQRFAKCCLEALKSKMNSTDQDIAGIPLQCLLIGESYAEDAVDFARLDNKKDTLAAVDIEIGTISNLYRSLIKKKMLKYESIEGGPKLNERELMIIHARLSWKLIFPDHLDDMGSARGPVGESEMEQVLKVGILEASGSKQAPRFLHRTFAEYFIAWYVVDELDKGQQPGEGLPKCFLRVLDSQDQIEMKLESFRFTYPVITYFIDALIKEIPIPSTRPSLPFPSLEFALRTAHSCINANYAQLFGLLSSTRAFENEAKEIFSQNFICLAIWNSSLELTKSVLKIFENHHKFHPTIQVEGLRTAIKSGKYSIVEYLFMERNLKQIVKEPQNKLSGLIHDCIENSKTSSDPQIEERILVLGLLADINPTLLKVKGGAWNEKPILSFGVHIQLLEELITLGADVHVQDFQGNTVLHMNYNRNHLSNKDYHKLLQSIGKEQLKQFVNLKGECQNTPLMSILRWIDPLAETLESFKDAGAFFNSIDVNGYSVLEIAIRNGRSTTKLIAFGAKINRKPLRWVKGKLGLKNKQEQRKTLLHYAAAYRNAEAVKLLLEDKRMDVNLKDEDDLTPLDYCIPRNIDDEMHLEIALLLKNHGCTLTKHRNSEGYPFLHMAARNSNVQLVKLLIGLGVDVNLTGKNGDTALHLLAYYRTDQSKPNNFPILQTLIAAGANPEILNNKKESPWDIALANTKYLKLKHFLKDTAFPVSLNWFVAVCSNEGIRDSEHFYLFAQEIASSVDVNFQDSSGNTLLNIAAEQGAKNAVSFLISSGANTNMTNNTSQTPLHLAVRHSDKTVSLELVKILIANGADPNAETEYNWTFLQYYIGFNSEYHPSPSQFHQMVEYLLSKGLSSLFTSNSCAALHLALTYVELEEKTLSLLHARNVDFNEVDNSGNSALNFGIRGKRSIKLIDALINRFGANPKHLSKINCSLLHEAAFSGTPEALEYLLNLKLLDVNGLSKDGSTPLHYIFMDNWTLQKNALKKCKLLIEHGADVNIINRNGKTAFAKALNEYNNQEDKAELLRLIQPIS